jgi:hypothetical protein
MLKYAAEQDPKDGGLMFCHAKHETFPRQQFCNLCKQNPCNCNGRSPRVKMIEQFITLETQAKKNKNKKKKKDEQVTGRQ